MTIIRTLIFWLTLFVFALIFSSIIIVLDFLNRPRNELHKFSTLWAKSVFLFNPWWKIQISGKENIPHRESVVFVANHSSQSDILVGFLIDANFRWLSKASMFKIPVFGSAMRRCGYIGVERGDLKSHQRSLEECRKCLSLGESVFFFPEGTRSHDGKIGKFKIGAFKLAKVTGSKIIPITLAGTHHMLPKGAFWVHKSQIAIHVHEPIDPESGDLDELANHARIVIDTHLQKFGDSKNTLTELRT